LNPKKIAPNLPIPPTAAAATGPIAVGEVVRRHR
jgi:hypothetical protein